MLLLLVPRWLISYSGELKNSTCWNISDRASYQWICTQYSHSYLLDHPVWQDPRKPNPLSALPLTSRTESDTLYTPFFPGGIQHHIIHIYNVLLFDITCVVNETVLRMKLDDNYIVLIHTLICPYWFIVSFQKFVLISVAHGLFVPKVNE